MKFLPPPVAHQVSTGNPTRHFHPPHATTLLCGWDDGYPMTEELWARCPGCGSLWTAPAFNHRMWECRACHSIFPVEPAPSLRSPEPGDGFILATRFTMN